MQIRHKILLVISVVIFFLLAATAAGALIWSLSDLDKPSFIRLIAFVAFGYNDIFSSTYVHYSFLMYLAFAERSVCYFCLCSHYAFKSCGGRMLKNVLNDVCDCSCLQKNCIFLLYFLQQLLCNFDASEQRKRKC